MGIAKLAVSADGDSTHIPATVADGLLVDVSNASLAVTGTVSVAEPVSVDDNGASLTVDAPVGTPANVQVGDGTRTATVRDTGASDSLNVSIVDAAGNQITSFSGSGVSHVDDAAFAVGVDDVVPIAGIFDDTGTDSVDENDAGALRMSGNRNLYTQIRDLSAERSAAVTAANALKTDGSAVTQPVSGTVTAAAQPGVDIGDVTVNNAAGAAAVNVQDGGNSLTVDGTVSLGAGAANIGDVDVLSVPAPLSTTGGGTEATALRVTVANDSTGVLSVDDNGGSLTVDGSVTANAGTNLNTSALALEAGGNLAAVAASASVLDDWDETNRAAVNTIAGQVGVQGASGTVNALTQRVVLATDVGLPAGTANIGDVDVLTLPAIPAGTNNIGDVDIASLPNEGQQTMANSISVAISSDQSALTVAQATAANLNAQAQGTAAHASPTSGNPVYIAGRASTAVPTDVGADGDAAGLWLNRNGAQIVSMAPHIGLVGLPWTLTGETAQYTTTQTSAVLVAGGASEKLVVTKVQIQVGGTTAGTLQLYFGTGAYSRGTSLAIFDGEFAPSATLKPGVVMDGPFISAANGDDLLVTTSAAINPLTITVWYYVVV